MKSPARIRLESPWLSARFCRCASVVMYSIYFEAPFPEGMYELVSSVGVLFPILMATVRVLSVLMGWIMWPNFLLHRMDTPPHPRGMQCCATGLRSSVQAVTLSHSLRALARASLWQLNSQCSCMSKISHFLAHSRRNGMLPVRPSMLREQHRSWPFCCCRISGSCGGASFFEPQMIQTVWVILLYGLHADDL